MGKEKLVRFGVALLLFWLGGGNYVGAKTNDVANLQLLFNIKYGTIYSTTPSPNTSVQPISHSQLPARCEEDETAGRANIVDFEYNPASREILWLSWHERLYSSQLEPKNTSHPEDRLVLWYDYYDYLQFSARRLAVDWLAGKLYTIDRFMNPTVELVDLAAGGKYRASLFGFGTTGKIRERVFVGPTLPEELEEASFEGMLFAQEFPAEIGVDSEAGYLFVRTNVSGSSRIHRANLDGSGLRLIVEDAGKLDLDCERMDVDRTNERVYWNNCGKGLIESVDYEGNERVSVVKAENVSALAVYDNWLFWSQYSPDNSTHGLIKYCNRQPQGACDPELIREISLPNVTDVIYKIRAVNPTPPPPPPSSVQNPCSVNNGGCQQLCLLKPSNSSDGASKLRHSCSCKLGYRLTANSRDCAPVLKYLVYESNNFLTSKTLEPLENRVIFNFPPQFVFGLLDGGDVAGVEYNPESDSLLYLECRNLLQMDLDENLRGCWALDRNETDCYKNLAYDWETGKVYVTKAQGKRGEHVLGVVDVPSEFNRRAIVLPAFLRSIDRPLSIVAHPKTGYVYLLTAPENCFSSSKSNLTRMTVGGYNTTVLNVSDAAGLAMDNAKNRLYWYTRDGEIRHSALDGTDVRTLAGKSPVVNVNSMLVDEEWIYVKNKSSIWRVRKENGDWPSCVVPEVKDTKLRSGMRIIQRSPERLDHGTDNQITKEACKVLCTYLKTESEQRHKLEDIKFCGCTIPKKED